MAPHPCPTHPPWVLGAALQASTVRFHRCGGQWGHSSPALAATAQRGCQISTELLLAGQQFPTPPPPGLWAGDNLSGSVLPPVSRLHLHCPHPALVILPLPCAPRASSSLRAPLDP